MPPNSSPRLYITFHEKAEVVRRAIIPLRPTYQQVLLDALNAYRLPEDRAASYGLKYGRKLRETIAWVELLPGSWSLVEDGDDLLLYSHQELGLQTAAMESFSTLVPASEDTRGVVKDTQARGTFDHSTRPMVTYRYVKSNKGIDFVAYAVSFLPETYEEAVDMAVSTLRGNTIAQDIKSDRVVLWARILDENGKRVNAVLPPKQFVELVSETLKKDPFCSIVVMPLGPN